MLRQILVDEKTDEVRRAVAKQELEKIYKETIYVPEESIGTSGPYIEPDNVTINENDFIGEVDSDLEIEE